MKYINYDIIKQIGYITINRPEKRNALNPELINELKQTFTIAEKDKKVKIIILKANGNTFCAGADLSVLKTLQNNSFEENFVDSKNLMKLYKLIYTLDKVVIAQVEGHAIAGGAGLATVCDFVFSIPEAKFGYPETTIGFVPAIVSVFLIRKIGEAKAKELLLIGEIISAQKAADYNIFNYIVKKDKIKKSVYNFAKELITNASSDSLRITKQLIADVQNYNYNEALNLAAEINAKSRNTKDCKRGISAFLNKTKIKKW